MARKRNKKRKTTAYRSITFKLTDRQKKSLEKNCKARKTTPIKLIKKSIDPFLSLEKKEKAPEINLGNQLELFGELENQIAE